MSLDKTREEYYKKVDKDKKLLLKVVLHLIRNKKILNQAKERACKKMLYLTDSLHSKGEEVNTLGPSSKDYLVAAITVSLLPAL